MWCDAMPSDDANSLILDMDMSWSIKACFVHTVWASKPINGIVFHQFSRCWQQNYTLATSLIDDGTRIKIPLMSCLTDELVADRYYRCDRFMALYILCWCTGLPRCIPYLTLDQQVSDHTKQMAHGVRDTGMARVYRVILTSSLPSAKLISPITATKFRASTLLLMSLFHTNMWT